MDETPEVFSADNESDNFIAKTISKIGENGVEEIEGALYVKGEQFDPDVHIVEDDKLPKLNSKGRLMRRRGVKKGASKDFKAITADKPKPKSKAPKSQKVKDAQESAETAALIMACYSAAKGFATGKAIDLPKLDDPQVRIQKMTETLAEICAERGIKFTFSPTSKLAGLLITDIVAEALDPQVREHVTETKKKLEKLAWYSRLGDKFKFWKKKDGNKTEDKDEDQGRGTDGDSGQDRDGENVPRETTSA